MSRPKLRGAIAIVCLCGLSAGARADGLSLLDAVKTTLARQPQIKVQEETVHFDRGVTENATGQFDWSVYGTLGDRGETLPQTHYYQSINGNLANLTTNVAATQLGLAKQFRWGMSVRPTLSLSRTTLTGEDPASGTARVNFQVIQPLFRGRGASSVAALETAAKIAEEAAMLSLRHIIAQQIQATAAAYWSYREARDAVAILVGAEERARLLLTDEQSLVNAGEHPPADLKQLEANLADQQAALIEGKRAEGSARQALGLVMGLPWREIDALAPPSDAFFTIDDKTLPDTAAIARLIDLALARRNDLAAARATVRSAGVLTTAARRNLEPQLDLEVDLGYNGLSEGNGAATFFTPVYDRIGGVNFYGGLNMQFPVENHVARGVLVQAEATQKRFSIQSGDLDRIASSNVSIAVGNLRGSAYRLHSADQAVAAYRIAVENERKRQKAGLSTLFDVVQIETRLTTAETNALNARRDMALALTALRFETGTLIDGDPHGGGITLEQLTTLPSP
jgi:outer membrane protein TolC